MTQPLVDKLNEIHDKNFGQAGEKIKKYQDRYKKDYDRRHKVQKFKFRKGNAIQVRNILKKAPKGTKNKIKWKPMNSFYVVQEIDKYRKRVRVKNPKTGKIFKKTYHFDDIREFVGAKK